MDDENEMVSSIVSNCSIVDIVEFSYYGILLIRDLLFLVLFYVLIILFFAKSPLWHSVLSINYSNSIRAVYIYK